MGIRYEKLLSPVAVGGVLLKNRMLATAAIPHYIQGVEPYPTEKVMTLLTNRAKNGAGVVYINHIENGNDKNMPGFDMIDQSAMGRFLAFDKNHTSTHTYLCQLIDTLRYYGSIAVTQPMAGRIGEDERPREPMDFRQMVQRQKEMERMREEREDYVDETAMDRFQDHTREVMDATPAQLQDWIGKTVREAQLYKALGFEMMSQHYAYMMNTPVHFMSETYNHRTDRYGGSLENRCRLILEVFDALKQTLGRDYPLECLISGEDEEHGISLADNMELARLAEGKIDLLHIRYGVQDPQHPTGFTSSRANPCPNLKAAAAIRHSIADRGGKMLVAVSAGLHEPDFCEKILQDGDADLIAMARTWICDSEYGDKLYEGRGEDVVPCVRCNKCHTPNDSSKFRSFCTVNPKIGVEDKLDKLIRPVLRRKKVAVVGGGPGGLYAAMTAADRGHDVTVYEKQAVLGGQLTHADYPSFKWPMADFKDYLIRQVYKRGIRVVLNTAATKQLLSGEGYDEVIVAIGPNFTRPRLPGADGPNTCFAVDVYGKNGLPKDIVVIGGSETGVETGMYLAENGHNVTVMCRQKDLAEDAAHAHYVAMLKAAYAKLPTFHKLCRVSYKAIEPDGVVYTDRKGETHKLSCGLVVLATGAVNKAEECAALYGAAPRTQYVGDCVRVGNVHQAISEGWGAANQI